MAYAPHTQHMALPTSTTVMEVKRVKDVPICAIPSHVNSFDAERMVKVTADFNALIKAVDDEIGQAEKIDPSWKTARIKRMQRRRTLLYTAANTALGLD